MALYNGKCHCGALGFRFETELPPLHWELRACQCSFCRAHGASCTSDPMGQVRFLCHNREYLQRYRFGLNTAEFLLCRNCGVYVGAVAAMPAGSFASLNVNVLAPRPELRPALAVDYSGESREERLDRRRKRWTPVTACAF